MINPIIITGCPRTGTRLAARIIGSDHQNYLITEHKNKAEKIPEDISGIVDHDLWKSDESPKQAYLNMSIGKRLVTKNPYHITRISTLQRMFPEAQFVFCVRNPWNTMRSMSIKAINKKDPNRMFLLRTWFDSVLPDDILYRVAVCWGYAIDVWQKEKTESWYVLKYENLISDPQAEIMLLSKFLHLNYEDIQQKISIPKKMEHSMKEIKKIWKKSKWKNEIRKAIMEGCKIFGYDESL